MKCSTAFCNRPAPMPSLEVPAPFCKWCTENPGSGRERPAAFELVAWIHHQAALNSTYVVEKADL